MKQLLLILAFLAGTYMTAHAETVKLVPSASDTTRMDTVVVSEMVEEDDAEMSPVHHGISFNNDLWEEGWAETSTMALVAIIVCCGLPFFIVGIVLWFRYKNKQAKYKLAAEALAAGQTIPKELFHDKEDQRQVVLSRGIQNIFLGIGLGVFFWVLTGKAGLAAIGFLIFCMGLGQVLIAHTTARDSRKDKSGPHVQMNKDQSANSTPEESDMAMTRNNKTEESHPQINDMETQPNDDKE